MTSGALALFLSGDWRACSCCGHFSTGFIPHADVGCRESPSQCHGTCAGALREGHAFFMPQERLRVPVRSLIQTMGTGTSFLCSSRHTQKTLPKRGESWPARGRKALRAGPGDAARLLAFGASRRWTPLSWRSNR